MKKNRKCPCGEMIVTPVYISPSGEIFRNKPKPVRLSDYKGVKDEADPAFIRVDLRFICISCYMSNTDTELAKAPRWLCM